MPILRLENGTTHTQLSDIVRELAPLNVKIDRWLVGENPQLKALLSQEILSDAEKEHVLKSLDIYFQQLQQTADYQSRDLIVLHPSVPNLDAMLSRFDRCHIHTNPEVRYIIDGEGIFGFVRPDASQVELTVQPEDYINVPSDTEHWFALTASRQIKAVRYFTTTEGWVPEYTNTEIRLHPASVLSY